MDPVTLLVLGGIAVADASCLLIIRIIQARKNPKWRMDKTVERAETEFERTSEEYLRDVDRFVKGNR